MELCELVSVRSLEIACFELFSSIPESFSVFSTERWAGFQYVCMYVCINVCRLVLEFSVGANDDVMMT